MLIDAAGTEYRSGRIVLPKDWIFRPKNTVQWWEPQGDTTHFKIVASAIVDRQKIVVWQGNFFDLAKALEFWQTLSELGPAPHQWDMPTPSWHPGLSIPGLVYEFATVQTFNSTPGGSAWTVPTGVTATDYLVVAGGGGGDPGAGGGGGAGGYRAATGFAVTPGASLTLTVGPGGASATNGTDSQFSTIVSTGGGRGNASNGGSGGGGRVTSGAGQGNTPSTSPSQGNNGGITTQTVNVGASGGGGGGIGGVGSDGSPSVGGNGAPGVQNNISGVLLYYAAGGGGSVYVVTTGSGGTMGVGGSSIGGSANINGIGFNGAANTGSGAGGGLLSNSGGSYAGGIGGYGVVILSYTVNAPYIPIFPRKNVYLRR